MAKPAQRRYVVVPMCPCGNQDLGPDGTGNVYCRSCGNRFLCVSSVYAVSGPQLRTIESWSTAWTRRLVDGLWRGPAPDAGAEGLRRELSAARENIATLTARNEEDAKTISDLTGRLAEAEAALETYKGDNARLRRELSDVDSSFRHVQSELADASKVDTRELARLFLDHLTWTYNAVLDGDVPEQFRSKVLARTEYTVSKAAGVGLTVTYHERGSALRPVRVEIDEVATKDPRLTRTVAKSNLFGCSFCNGLPQIPESVTVNRFVETRLAVVDEPRASGTADDGGSPGTPPGDSEAQERKDADEAAEVEAAGETDSDSGSPSAVSPAMTESEAGHADCGFQDVGGEAGRSECPPLQQFCRARRRDAAAARNRFHRRDKARRDGLFVRNNPRPNVAARMEGFGASRLGYSAPPCTPRSRTPRSGRRGRPPGPTPTSPGRLRRRRRSPRP